MTLLRLIYLSVCLAGIVSLQPFIRKPSRTLLLSSRVAKHRYSFTRFAREREDVRERRRKRRGKKEEAVATESSSSKNVDTTNSDGSSSLEDLFGLGNDQLRELMEQELPVPREDVSTGKTVKESDADKNKVFKLPDLSDFVGAGTTEKEVKSDLPKEERIDRSNQEEYLRVLQLNPFADADESKFVEEYDILTSIFGSGKLLGIPIPYLQQGHGMLLIIALLAGLVYAPGNPLTEFPPEIRNFLKQGLVNVYAINSALAVRAFFVAKAKNLPPIFWAIKTFILGGIPLYELSQAKDPTTLVGGDRASRRRESRKK